MEPVVIVGIVFGAILGVTLVVIVVGLCCSNKSKPTQRTIPHPSVTPVTSGLYGGPTYHPPPARPIKAAKGSPRCDVSPRFVAHVPGDHPPPSRVTVPKHLDKHTIASTHHLPFNLPSGVS